MNTTKLFEAVSACNINEVKFLLEAKVNVNAEDDYALRLASEKGYISIVKLLLDNNANVNAMEDYALRFASGNECVSTIEMLLSAKANVHADDDYAIRIASNNNRFEIVSLLIKANADVTADENEALTYAIGNENEKLVKVLLDAKANITMLSEYLDCILDNTNILKLLLDNKDIGNMESIDMNNTLYNASDKEKTEAVKLLLSFGADINNLTHKFIRNHMNITNNMSYILELDSVADLSKLKKKFGSFRFKYSEFLKLKVDIQSAINYVFGKNLGNIVFEYI